MPDVVAPSDSALLGIAPTVHSAGATTDNPWVPVVLATYEVEPIDDIIESFGDVPADYAELAMLTTVISRHEPLGSPPIRLDPTDAGQLAFRLFSTVREAHQLSATLSRAGGCSLLPESVTPTGDLTDAYFLTAGDEFDATDLAQLQVRDIANAVHLLTQTVAPFDPLLAAIICAGSTCTPECRSGRQWLNSSPR